MSTGTPKDTEIVYPESDGKPMADNTLQWDWMVKIVGELRGLFAGQDVLVAGDLFWYPVQGNPKAVIAPDALVVFGRPPGYRGSYKQWEEGGIAPQVVFEVLSPNKPTTSWKPSWTSTSDTESRSITSSTPTRSSTRRSSGAATGSARS